jgi:alkyl hydroperoxide reductase subunit D
MSLESLKNRLPDYARDLKLNLGSLATEPGLTEQQRAGTFIASALAARESSVIQAIVAEFGPKLSPEAFEAAKAAAAIMGMNNIYYRFVHLMGEGNAENQYKSLPAKLRMNIIGKPGVEKVDFELWSLAVSAVNGCGMCLIAHEHELRKGGLSAEQVQQAVRIAAVVHAVAATLDGEATLGGGLTAAAA